METAVMVVHPAVEQAERVDLPLPMENEASIAFVHAIHSSSNPPMLCGPLTGNCALPTKATATAATEAVAQEPGAVVAPARLHPTANRRHDVA